MGHRVGLSPFSSKQSEGNRSEERFFFGIFTVFFLPFVKYDFKSVMEEGPESHAKLSRIFHQMYLRMCIEGHEGVRAKSGKGSILISDVKGLSREHFSTPFCKSIKMILITPPVHPGKSYCSHMN